LGVGDGEEDVGRRRGRRAVADGEAMSGSGGGKTGGEDVGDEVGGRGVRVIDGCELDKVGGCWRP
jgi:hypothetical protein